MAENEKKPFQYKSKLIESSRIDLASDKYNSIYSIQKEVTDLNTLSVTDKPVIIFEKKMNKWVDKFGYQNLVVRTELPFDLFVSASNSL